MRRLKSDVAKSLPKKIELKEYVDIPTVQEYKYCSVVSDYETGLQPNMLLTIMNIREISEHPYLYDSTLDDYNNADLINILQKRIKLRIGHIESGKQKMFMYIIQWQSVIIFVLLILAWMNYLVEKQP